MNLIKRIRTLWVLSSWDIQKNKKEGVFTIDGIVRPEPVSKDVFSPFEKKLAQIISMKPKEDDIEELLKDNQEKKDDNN